MSSSHISNQSLQWTRPLLDELFEDVRQAVERFGDSERERRSDDLNPAIDACEKVAGSLAVMEFSSGQLIADAMGLALAALKRGASSDEATTIERILEATAILPDYLDYLESSQRDMPVVVLPTINDLRASAGEASIDEATFFRPEVSGVGLPEPNNETGLAQLRRDYQHALRGFLINHQDAEAIGILARTALRIRDSSQAPDALRRLGWSAAALCEALEAGQIAGGSGITRLFARIDVMLKDLAEHPNDPDLLARTDDLCRGVLYQIALARAETPLAQEVREAFDLAEHAPDQMAQAKVFLAGRNRALFAAVTQAAREDLAKIKDALGSQLERDSDPTLLGQQTALLESVGESLAMLGLDHLASRVKTQAGKLSELGNNPDDPALLMVARELLVVESQLEESFGLAGSIDDEGEADLGEAMLLPPSEQRRVLKQMVKEALEDLAHAKHLLDAINRQKADDNALDEARSILERIAGALYVANLGDSARMLEAASEVAGDHLAPGSNGGDPPALEALAETLTVTEFYLESLTSQDDRGHRYLASAHDRLVTLGYLPAAETSEMPVAETSAESSAEASTEAEVESDDAAVEMTAPESEPSGEALIEDIGSLDELDLGGDEEMRAAADSSADKGASESDESSDELLELHELDLGAQDDEAVAPEPSDRTKLDDLDLDELGESPKAPSEEGQSDSDTGKYSTDESEEIVDWPDDFDLEELDADQADAEALDELEDLDGVFSESDELDEELRADKPEDTNTPPAPPSDIETSASAFDDFDIVEIFLEEFDQELESLRAIVPQWQERPGDKDNTLTIRRAFHSLKGSGRMAGAMEIGEFAWCVENLLNRVLEGQLKPDTQVTALVAEAVEALPSMRARLAGEGETVLDEEACRKIAERAELAADGKLDALEREEVELDAPLAPELEGLDPTLIELMIKELSDNLETLEQWLQGSEDSGHTPDIDESMVRVVHTMKGTMRLAPIGDETETAQILEAYLEELSLCQAPPSSDGLAVMTRCTALFRQRLERLRGETVEDSVFESAELAGQLRALHNQAHRDRTGEHAPHYDGARSEVDEAVFSSDADVETTENELDFFDVEDEEVTADDAEPAENVEGEALFEPSPDADNSVESDEGEDQVPEHETVTADEVALGADPEAGELVDADGAEDDDRELDHEPEADEDIEAEAEAEADAEAETGTRIDADTEAEPESESESDEDLPDWMIRARAEEARSIAMQADGSSQRELPEQPEAEPEVAESGDSNLIEIDYSEVNDDLLEAFLEEGQELLEHADSVLQRWREQPEDKSLVTALQRDLHTIKGSSRMVGLNPIGQVAHVMEELLEGIASGLKDPTRDRIDALETGCDQLHLMIDAVVKREAVPMRPLDELFADQAAELEDSVDVPEMDAEAERNGPAEQDARLARSESLRVPSNLIDELVNYAGEISIFRSRLEQQISVFRNNVGEVDETVIRLRDQLRKLEIETEAQILARYEREHGPSDEQFDPLELDRYSTIQQLSRALAESVNDLTSLTGILDDATRQSETLLMQQSRVNTELQEGLMQARMVSFNTLLPRFRRVIRNAAREVGKKAQLRVELAGEGELDRNVLERITAPLEHLLRNAISHGIETPDKRKAQGKPETGTVSIDVSREATELVMRIADDGAGLNLDAIRQRAIERGLLDDLDADERTLTQMIFRSGFSTAAQVSELAGRGIGMDVVANEVRQIGGSVTAQSRPGEGALFVIRIPLSLTVMQAIMVRASDRQFAIPLQSVRGVTRILADEWLRAVEGPEPLQEYAGDSYPMLELEPQLEFAPEDVTSGTLSLLMVEAGEQRAALRVSELLGHREIVIKPVGPQISSIPGILGGTIAGDGQVISILDIGPLIRRAFEHEILPGRGGILESEQSQEVKRTPLVMVVDDSITMRRVTSRVLEHRGLEVITARDGLDAVEAMFERVPDAILLDIEMPRMDGYELAGHVRNDPRLKHVPMMMITSRSGEKHRQRARELGVNDYLAKPYQEAELVQHVFDLLNMTSPEG